MEPLGQHVLEDVLAAAVGEAVARTGVGEADLQGRAVEAGHLGVLTQQDPGEAPAALDRVQNLRPHLPYLRGPLHHAGRGGGLRLLLLLLLLRLLYGRSRGRTGGRPGRYRPRGALHSLAALPRGHGRRPAAGLPSATGAAAGTTGPRPGPRTRLRTALRGRRIGPLLLTTGAATGRRLPRARDLRRLTTGPARTRTGTGTLDTGPGTDIGTRARNAGTSRSPGTGIHTAARTGTRPSTRARPGARARTRPRTAPAARGPPHRGPRGRRSGRARGCRHRVRLRPRDVPGRRPALGGHHRRPGPEATGRRRAHATAAQGQCARAALQPVQARLHRPLVVVRRGQQHPRADQLQLQPRRGRPPHLRQARIDQIGGPAQLRRPEDGRLRRHPLHHIRRGIDQPLLPRVGHRREDHQIPQPLQQIGHEPPRIVAPLDDPVDHLEGRRPVPRGERLDDGVQQRAVGVPQQSRRHGIRHTVGTRPGEQLVHHRHRIPHGPGPGPYDQRQHTVLDRDVLPPAHLGQVFAQRPRRHQPEGVVMRPRPDRPDDLLGLGRREDELQMLRRLLDDLEQGIEPRRGHHVRLVDDVDLVPAARRPEERLLPQLTGVVHATVRCGVDLDHIDRAPPVPGEIDARLARPAGRRSGTFFTVQAPRQDPRTGRLATAARPAEQIRVVDPVVPQRLLQRVGHVLLPDDLGEGLGSVAAVQRKGRHAYDDIGPH